MTADLPFALVAPRIGITRRRRRYGPCPACGATTHHGRAPVWATGPRWTCTACQTRGDAITAVSFALHGHGRPRGADFAAVLHFLDGHGLLEVTEEPAPAPPPKRLPEPDLRAALRSCTPISETDHPEVLAWLHARHIPTSAPAGVLPRHFTATWWPRPHWPLVVPAFDGRGRLASMHGRAVTPSAPRKTTWPRDANASGLLFANQIARAWLRGDATPGTILFAEGLPDYLTAAAAAGDIAVLGVESGSAAAYPELSPPPASVLYVGTHADEAGDAYACAIATAFPRHLTRRIPLERLRAA